MVYAAVAYIVKAPDERYGDASAQNLGWVFGVLCQARSDSFSSHPSGARTVKAIGFSEAVTPLAPLIAMLRNWLAQACAQTCCLWRRCMDIELGPGQREENQAARV